MKARSKKRRRRKIDLSAQSLAQNWKLDRVWGIDQEIGLSAETTGTSILKSLKITLPSQLKKETLLLSP